MTEYIDPATALLISALFWLALGRMSASERRERRAARAEYAAYQLELLASTEGDN